MPHGLVDPGLCSRINAHAHRSFVPQTRKKCSNLSFQESDFSSCHYSQAFEDRDFTKRELLFDTLRVQDTARLFGTCVLQTVVSRRRYLDATGANRFRSAWKCGSSRIGSQTGLKRLHERLQAVTAKNPATRLAGFARAYLEYAQSDPETYRLIFMAANARSPNVMMLIVSLSALKTAIEVLHVDCFHHIIRRQSITL